ncbi:MAG: hypothetical protein ACFB9N_08565 [Geitlerinemataceae cyanobacterium]
MSNVRSNLFVRVAQWLTQPDTHGRAIGIAVSSIFALVLGLFVVRDALVDPLIVQDDVRQHVFWMVRFANPELLPNDPIADYFQSVAPLGYTTLYRIVDWLGVAPFVFSRFLPVLIALATTLVVYEITLELLALPLAGFLASAILNMTLWMKDDLVSATPRAFVYLVLAVFLLGVVRRSWWQAALGIVLTVSFYPQYAIVEGSIAFVGGCAAVLPALVGRLSGKSSVFAPTVEIGAARWFFSLWLLAIVVLIPYAIGSGEYGPTIGLEEARQSAEFWPRGRSRFFDEDLWKFWTSGDRSGFFPNHTPTFLWFGVFLPVVTRFPGVFPLVKQLDRKSALFGWWLLTTVGLFGLAHLLLFRLHLPSRYTHHNLKLMMSIASAIFVTICIEALWRGLTQSRRLTVWGVVGGVFGAALLFSVAASPLWLHDNTRQAYRTGREPELYAFLQTTPIASKLAGIDGEINNLPTLVQRSIVFGFEYAIPYHQGYYQPLKQRGIDMIEAFYSPDRARVAAFVERYDLGFWVVRRSSFNAEALRNDERLGGMAKSEFQDDPMVRTIATAIDSLEAGQTPTLAQDIDRCAVFERGDFAVLDAACTANQQ